MPTFPTRLFLAPFHNLRWNFIPNYRLERGIENLLEKSEKWEKKMQTKSKVKALSDCVVIRPEQPASETPGGITLPEQAQDKPQRGVVVAIGPGVLLRDGTRVEMQVNEGDTVVYSKYSGTEVEVNDETLLVVRQNDLLLVVE